MKQYLLSFIISLGTTAAVSCLNYFQSTPISCLGGLVLAAVTYWRLSAIGKVNNRILGNSIALVLGWLVIPACIYISSFRAALGSFFISMSFGLSVILACLCYRFRKRTTFILAAAVWLAFVYFAVGGWDDYLNSLPRNGMGKVILPF